MKNKRHMDFDNFNRSTGLYSQPAYVKQAIWPILKYPTFIEVPLSNAQSSHIAALLGRRDLGNNGGSLPLVDAFCQSHSATEFSLISARAWNRTNILGFVTVDWRMCVESIPSSGKASLKFDVTLRAMHAIGNRNAQFTYLSMALSHWADATLRHAVAERIGFPNLSDVTVRLSLGPHFDVPPDAIKTLHSVKNFFKAGVETFFLDNHFPDFVIVTG